MKNGLRSRADGQFDFAAARFHAFEGLGQFSKSDFFSNKVLRGNIAAAHGFERFADEAWRVVESQNNSDFRVVNRGGLNFHFGAGGQAAEKIDHSAAADQA